MGRWPLGAGLKAAWALLPTKVSHPAAHCLVGPRNPSEGVGWWSVLSMAGSGDDMLGVTPIFLMLVPTEGEDAACSFLGSCPSPPGYPQAPRSHLLP